MLVQRVLREAPFAMRQLADESGLSYGALRAWSSGDRIPQPESRRQLAAGLRTRAARLQVLADELDRAGEGE